MEEERQNRERAADESEEDGSGSSEYSCESSGGEACTGPSCTGGAERCTREAASVKIEETFFGEEHCCETVLKIASIESDHPGTMKKVFSGHPDMFEKYIENRYFAQSHTFVLFCIALKDGELREDMSRPLKKCVRQIRTVLVQAGRNADAVQWLCGTRRKKENTVRLEHTEKKKAYLHVQEITEEIKNSENKHRKYHSLVCELEDAKDTPRFCVSREHYRELMQMLLQKGADICRRRTKDAFFVLFEFMCGKHETRRAHESTRLVLEIPRSVLAAEQKHFETKTLAKARERCRAAFEQIIIARPAREQKIIREFFREFAGKRKHEDRRTEQE